MVDKVLPILQAILIQAVLVGPVAARLVIPDHHLY
jgi:hypothetical protein